MSFTRDFIGDSSKKVDRDPYMQKQGSVADGTEAAHKLSWGLLNVIETHTPGAPMGDASRYNLSREMNGADNLRIKTMTGNRVTDEHNDGRVSVHYMNDTPLQTRAEIARAEQAFSGAQTLSNPKYAEELGNMKVRNPETRRDHLLKNHHKYK